MQSETMPSELNLSAPPTIPQARTYISKQQSEFPEYDISKGNKIRVDIPRLQKSYLMKDSYIRFRVNLDINNTETDFSVLAFDKCGAFGLFDRIEVYDYLGGTLLEQTNNIPTLISILNDIQHNITDSFGKNNTCHGFGVPFVTFQNTTPDIDANENDAALAINPPVNGAQLTYRKTEGIDQDTALKLFYTQEFTLPVMSFLGMLCSKYAPLHNGFTIYFHLNDAVQAFISRRDEMQASPSSFQLNQSWISNFEYVTQIMELGEQAESIVMGSEPLVLPSKHYRHFTDTILGAGTQSNFRFDLNLNVVSLRNLFFCMRPYVFQNNILYPGHGHRIRNFLESWNFQYGSSYLPEIAGISCRSTVLPTSRVLGSVPIKTDYSLKSLGYCQALEELSKVNDDGKLTNIDRFYCVDTFCNLRNDTDVPFNNTVTIPWQYNKAGALLSQNTYHPAGQFVGGLNTRLSKKSTISGIDTNGLQVSINGQFDRDNVNNMVDAILDVWAEHDSFVQIIPGVASTVTF